MSESLNKKQKEKIISAVSKDMLKFGKVCLPNMFSQESPEFHKEITEIFHNKEIKKINIIAPRGHAKSSIGAGVFPLHHILCDPGQKVVVLSSKTQGHSIDQLQTIKDALEYSMPLRAIFGYWGQHSAKVWTKDRVVLKDNSAIICKGTGQQVRGLKFGNQRPTLFILDDPEDENNTKTSEAMEWNLRWLLQGVEPGLDPHIGRVLVIGTPQHQSCLVETLDVMKGYTTKRYKAMLDDGTALWEEQVSLRSLKEKKNELESIGRLSVFYREYQCEVVGDEDQFFVEDNIHYWDGEFEKGDGRTGYINFTRIGEDVFDTPVKKHVHVFMGIDPASSIKKTADYSVIMPIAVDSEDNRYVLPYFRKRVKPMDLAASILQYDTLYAPAKAHIESVAYQEMLRDYITTKRFIPGFGKKINPRTSKSSRLESLQPWFFQNKVFIKRDMTPLVDELLMYPRGRHDDLLDGLYYAFMGSYTPPEEEFETRDDQKKNRGFFDWSIL